MHSTTRKGKQLACSFGGKIIVDGTIADLCPADLREALPFPEWLRVEVQSEEENSIEGHPEEDVVQLSRPPSNRATKYRSMWAFGNHLRVVGVEAHLKTCDSGVAATFHRPCRAGLRDPNPVMADIEYVGHLEEIIELNYGGLCVVVLICSWVKANYRGNAATIKKDRWGFTVANFARLIPLGPESFALPMHVAQVFYSDARGEPGWKIVLRKEVRGKRVHENVGVEEAAGIFDAGMDGDHEGLRPPAVVFEENPDPSRTGRNIQREDAFAEWIEEPNAVYDGNVGDAGSSSGGEAD